MDPTAPFSLHVWEGFYVIVGTTAGALIGLQFVVLTLITEAGMIRGTSEAFSAFGSPNIMHFCGALLVSAIFAAPWHDMGPPGIAVALAGASGFVYSVIVLRRATRQRSYRPVLEDWIWHAALPMVAYAALVYAGIRCSRTPVEASFIVGAATLLLVFIGIHNAWDTVTYVMFERARQRKAVRATERAVAAGSTESPAPPMRPS